MRCSGSHEVPLLGLNIGHVNKGIGPYVTARYDSYSLNRQRPNRLGRLDI